MAGTEKTAGRPTILIVGCLEKRHAEVVYLREQVGAVGGGVEKIWTKVLDVSGGAGGRKGIPDEELVAPGFALGGDGAVAIQTVKQLVADHKVHAIIGVVGLNDCFSVVKLMVTAAAFDFPTLLVAASLDANSGMTAVSYGIFVMSTQVEITGHLNDIVKHILTQAAGAIIGTMFAWFLPKSVVPPPSSSGKRIAMSMSTAMEKCADLVRVMLTTTTPDGVAEYQIIVFRCELRNAACLLQRLVENGRIDGLVDLGGHQVSDYGVAALQRAAKRGLPIVIGIDAEASASSVSNTISKLNLSQWASDLSKITLLTPAGPASSTHSSLQLSSLKSSITNIDLELNLVEVSDATTPNSEIFAKAVCKNLLDRIDVDPRTCIVLGTQGDDSGVSTMARASTTRGGQVC